jgi:hypothetical protein
VAVMDRIDRIQTRPLLGGRVRIRHAWECQTRFAQAMRLRYCRMTEQLGSEYGCSQDQTAEASSVAGGSWWKERRPRQAQRTERVQVKYGNQHVSRWLERAGRDVRKSSQSASLPAMKWDGTVWGSVAGQRRGPQVGCRTGQDGSFVKARDDRPTLSKTVLPWSRRQLSEAGPTPGVVSRGQSMRRRLLLVGEKVAPGQRNQTRAELVAGR